MNRVQNTKIILWTLVGLAAAVGMTRFLFGLGATTNLTDATPWGIWIGFDVVAGVALAGGGFVITAVFYIFKRERFHDLVKPAVLTAFLGYLAVIFGLMFDLGLPWNIWHMMIYWNPNSPLFEVGWCVMLYATVLILEFSPVPLEEFSRYARVRSLLLKFKFPLVLLGIMLSTLHQSSLGSLFLIMPDKLHSLWYSSLLPIQFFISAAALGLMMVSLESLVSHWLYRRKAESNLVSDLAKAAVWVLLIYLIVKVIDLAVSGEMQLAFSGSWESRLFLAELLISTIIPIILFSIPKIRTSLGGQWIGSSMVVLGMILNRLNVGGLSMLRATGDSYVPSWMEIAITLGVISVAGLVFLFAIERFNFWPSRPRHPENDRHAQPGFDYSSRVWLGAPLVAARTKYSLVFILGFALGLALIPGNRIESKGIDFIPAGPALGGDTLFIDGNGNAFGTSFDHVLHVDSLGQKKSCTKCHHMNMPRDKQSGCWECHRSMYTQTNAFDHDYHCDPDGAAIACDICHEPQQERQKGSAKKCNFCHTDLYDDSQADTLDIYMALSYVDAMHGQCLDCHLERAAQDSTKVAQTKCGACHEDAPQEFLSAEVKDILSQSSLNNVVLPEIMLKSLDVQGISNER